MEIILIATVIAFVAWVIYEITWQVIGWRMRRDFYAKQLFVMRAQQGLLTDQEWEDWREGMRRKYPTEAPDETTVWLLMSPRRTQ